MQQLTMKQTFTQQSLAWRHALLVPVFALAMSSSSAWAVTYTFTTLQVPGGQQTQASDINDTGQIVGSFNDGTLTEHGFFRDSGGVFTTLDVPGAIRTQATGINDAGLIVGLFQDATGDHGFLRSSGGVFTTLDVPGATRTDAYGINDAGEIVGLFRDTTSTDHGFFRSSGGVFTTLDRPGAVSTGVAKANDAGQMVGVFSDTGNDFANRELAAGDHGFLRDSGGGFTTLDAPGATFTGALGINDAGQIVGLFGDGAGNHGFFRDSGGIFTTLNVPGATTTEAQGINSAGQIVGDFNVANATAVNQTDGFNFRGFLATPVATPGSAVPEPASLLLLGSGLAGLVAWRRSQKG